MADEQAAEQPDTGDPKAINQPHDEYFQRVLGRAERREPAEQLRAAATRRHPVADAEPEWRWEPRVEHLLIDQTEQDAESVTGGAATRQLQIVMMVAFRESAGGVAAGGGADDRGAVSG